MNNSDLIALACQLIERESVTPNDAGCQQLMADFLAPIGFSNESLVFHDTTNLWSRKGNTSPNFCFAGHTDVVPAGDLSQWLTDPFEPSIKNGVLYGRGAADMKGSLAAMLIATKRFITDYPDHQGSISFLITSDEEGPFINGTTKVIDTLQARNETIDYCIVGEPSSQEKLADIVKNGRRGSISAELTIYGKQGHVAYPEHVINPIHLAVAALTELSQQHWDQGNQYFPATSFQLTNMEAGTGATNVVPAFAKAWFNLRFSSELTFELIVSQVEHILAKHQLNYDIDWTYNGQPFLTKPAELVAATQQAITKVTGEPAQLSTSGGTSDGRFIAPTGAQVVELGPVNKTIHQVNECVSCDELAQLSQIYYLCLVNLLGQNNE